MTTHYAPMKDLRRANVSGFYGKYLPKPKPRLWDVYRSVIESKPTGAAPGVTVSVGTETLKHIGTVEEATGNSALTKARELFKTKATDHITVMPRNAK